ncbi:serine protease htrA-like protein [Striga asiatica]|uniref:Serine protease htrA-like protein n=1 Tax=Striga asiatica TaxID=4170 RepID=A0A5A7QYL3_STRAF|nr:serine protease htrA-like protein [Striga asiatica]
MIECDNVNGFFECTILTSANLLRINAYDKSLAKNLKVEVILPGGSSCLGDVISVDWHFNISAIRIQSSAPLPTAKLRCLDDAIQTHDLSRPQVQQNSSLLKLLPGDDFIALGRHYSEPYDLMVAPGKFRLVTPKVSLWTISTECFGIGLLSSFVVYIFSIDRCELDCKELLRVNCMITKCGIGGAMVNLYGEVVGINFYAKEFTPFLPMNVVCKWWDHVAPNSPAGSVSVQPNDIIVECDGVAITNENLEYDVMKDSFKTRFSLLYWNRDLDIYVKRIANKAAPSVVSLQVSSGGNEIFGFVIECDTVITSASLLNFLDTQSGDLKVCVGLCDGEKCDGVIVACDFHYNLAAIKIQAGKPLQIARLKYLDDSICIYPTNLSIGKLHEMHSDLFRIFPGERVIALGRFIDDIGDIMVSPGEFSVEQCRLDCEELLRSTGRITQCGIGGPMINRKAEVIGVNFFHFDFTPFLPINIVSKWWSHYTKYKNYCRPWLGMELSNLFTVEVCTWEKIIQKFPSIKMGILVDEVAPNSPAGSVNVQPNDIIVECDGVAITSNLQLFDLLWDKTGNMVKLGLARTSDGSRENLSVMVADAPALLSLIGDLLLYS